MNVELMEATENDRELIENLAQLYAYDFSEFVGFDVQPAGRYAEADLGVWPSDSRRCFVIRVDGPPASR